MTCKTPCSDCSCESVYNSDYIEIDPSPLATQSQKFLANPANFFTIECALNPSSPHCRTTDV